VTGTNPLGNRRGVLFIKARTHTRRSGRRGGTHQRQLGGWRRRCHRPIRAGVPATRSAATRSSATAVSHRPGRRWRQRPTTPRTRTSVRTGCKTSPHHVRPRRPDHEPCKAPSTARRTRRFDWSLREHGRPIRAAYGEGEHYLGFVNVTTCCQWDANFLRSRECRAAGAQFVSATATIS